MNWADLAKDFPMTYEDFMGSKLDIEQYVQTKGIVGYMFDPSVTGQGYMWEVKYLDRNWNITTTCDAVLTTEHHAYERMMWRIFWTIDNKQSITMEEYEKADKDFTPEDWKKAVRDVEGLMGLYTSAAVRRHKQKKFWSKMKKK
jgi:hypothetical protein